MIESISIRNYQSLEDVTLALGSFTVLVGPSSSGKSAVTRAIKALASNQSGKGYITHGETTTQITAVTDKGTVTLTKGKPEDSYVILANDDIKNPRRYTKLGVSVPEDVTAFLGIDQKDAINFAGQFDMPYLLKTSSSEVARVLGELTNVSSIFEASREALRLKNSYSATLKVKQTDEERLVPLLSKFENLPERTMQLQNAEYSHAAAMLAEGKLNRLNDLLLTLKTATSRLNTAQQATDAPLPDLESVQRHFARTQRLSELTALIVAAKSAQRIAIESKLEATAGIEAANEEYETALHEAGTCPTCGQNTEGVHIHA